MPHGYQWSHEEIRNAERAAKIQAQAIAEEQRKERMRQEREERMRPTQHAADCSSASAAPPVSIGRPSSMARKAAEKRVANLIAESRAEKAMRATFGTADYIHNRYGHVVWCGKITEYRNKFGCSEEEAIELLVRNYKESEWAHLEDPLIEAFMGHRK